DAARLLDLARDDLDGPAEGARALEVADEVGQRRERRRAAVDGDGGARLAEAREPEPLRQAAADLIQQRHRRVLPGAELLDEGHALLQLRALRLELLDLLEDGGQALAFGLCLLDGDAGGGQL